METRSKTRQVNNDSQFEGKKRITTTKFEMKKAKMPAAPPFILHRPAKEEKFEILLMQRIMEKKKLFHLMILI